MTVVGLVCGTTGPAVAYLDQNTMLTSLQISWWRLAIAFWPSAVVALLRARRNQYRASPRDVAVAFSVGVAAAGSQYSYFVDVASAGIAVPTLVALSAGPVLAALGDAAILHTPPDRKTFAALLGALLGLALLVLDGPIHAP